MWGLAGANSRGCAPYVLAHRDNAKLSTYVDTASARVQMMQELRKLIEANPKFNGKLSLPTVPAGKLSTLLQDR